MFILEFAALILGIGTLILIYAVVAWVLTLARQGRPVRMIVVTRAPAPVPAEVGQARYAPPLPEAWRIPIQPGHPNDLIIHIEPEEAVAARRALAERLIAHLSKKVG